MDIEFDPAKDFRNIQKHGISLAFIFDILEDPKAVSFEDRRRAYGEKRIITLGKIQGRIFYAVHTERNGKFRPISLRKANAREQKIYHRHT